MQRSEAKAAVVDHAIDLAAGFMDSLVLSDIPADVQSKARDCLYYGFGIGAACVHNSYARAACAAMSELDGAPAGSGAVALATGDRLPVSAAAFCNAVLLHGRCQEDTVGSAHLGVVVLPVLLALSEAGWGDPGDLLIATVAGYQVGAALERAFGKDTTANGFRASPLYGTVAAAAAAARFMGLSRARMASALAHACAFTGGTLQPIVDGGDEWRHQMGVAARRGLEAAFLARQPGNHCARAVEGPFGLAGSYARRAGHVPRFDDWLLSGVAFKPYPVCNRNQAAAALACRIGRGMPAADLRGATFRIHPNVLDGMLHAGPFRQLGETVLSVPFCCAVGLSSGHVSLAALCAVDDPATMDMLRRVEVVVDDSVPYLSAQATVLTRSGERLEFAQSRGDLDAGLTRAGVGELLARLADEVGISPLVARMLDEATSRTSIDPRLILQACEVARQGASGTQT